MPEAYVDHHHMGGNGARISLPPYAEPVRPSADPLLWREISWYGAHMAYKEAEAEPVRRHRRRDLFRLGAHGLPLDHAVPQHRRHAHRVGEREARLAALHPARPVEGRTPATCPITASRRRFPNPWPGGWWRLRDIVERQKVVGVGDARSRGAQSRNRAVEHVSEGEAADRARRAGRNQGLCRLGESARSADRRQDDQQAARRRASRFGRRQAPIALSTGTTYPAGSFVVPMAQPKMGVVRWMLGRTFYPDNSYTRDKRQRADPSLRHGDGHDDRVHGRAVGSDRRAGEDRAREAHRGAAGFGHSREGCCRLRDRWPLE